jgi:hypothetical protein
MKGVPFKGSNKTLAPSNQEYSSNVTGVEPLPIWTDGEFCVSCWKMSFRERLSALLFGRVWLAVLSGVSHEPVSVRVARSYLEEV